MLLDMFSSEEFIREVDASSDAEISSFVKVKIISKVDDNTVLVKAV